MATHAYKVGDMVHARGRGGVAGEHVGQVISIDDDGDCYVEFNDGWQDGHEGEQNDGAKNRWFFVNSDLRPVAAATERKQESGPVRTVTRREIVPGVYGSRGEIVLGKAGTCTMVKIAIDASMSKKHLREAAHLFNQIAEVLEEQQEAA